MNKPFLALAVGCVALVALAACGRRSADPEVPGVFRPLAESCCRDEQRCAGPNARVSFWSDPAGAPRRMVWSGDLNRCSHVMTWVFDERGTELLANSGKAVSPERAEALRAEWDALFAGLRESPAMTCREVVR